MTPERWNSIKEVFQAALERDETVRAAFLDGACGSDTELRQEVDRLLWEHGESTKLKSPVATADRSGRTLSHYKILDKIGEGGMGVVYKAEDTKLDRTVALKFLATHVLASAEHKTRFMQEAKAAAAIDHPNICTIHEIDEADGQTFLAMAHVDGETLSAKVRKRPLPLDEAMAIAIQTAQGLEAAHKKGIVHRDIKSANIMTDTNGRVKVMDFGLAHLAGGTKITETGTVIGTPAYMSPEQVRGEKTDHRTDIWSLGVVIYEMVTGQLPFSGESAQSVALAIQNEKPEPMTALRAGVPMELERIIGKTLAKRASERYQHVEDLLVDLRSLTKPVTVEPSPLAHRNWRKAILVAAAAVMMVAIAALVISRLREQETGPPAPPVPFTTDFGNELGPVFSPDGGRIAYVGESDEVGNFDIYIKQVEGAGKTRLTRDPAPDVFPAWSPNGNEIVFARLRFRGQGLPRYEFFVIPSIGGPERRLTEVPNHWLAEATILAAEKYWSPDGRFLVLCAKESRQANAKLLRYSMDTRELSPLWQEDSPETRIYGTSFSPDGRNLAFVRWKGMKIDIYCLSLDNDGLPQGEPRRLTFDEASVIGLDWTPEGRSLVFSSARAGAPSLWRIPADGGEPTPLAYGGGQIVSPSVARQGNRLAFTHKVTNQDIWRVDIERAKDEDVTSPKRLISSTWMDFTPRYSPDGKKIAFTSKSSGHHEIWVCDSDGSNRVQLTDMKSLLAGDARWSPDGLSIAFDSTKESHHDIYVINAGGGEPRRVTTDPTWEYGPSWSRDGKWIYFSSRLSGGEMRLLKIPLDGGPAVELARTGRGRLEGLESPDGKFVYYATDDPGVWRVPVDGGEPTRVLEHGHVYGWAMTDDGIYVLGPGQAVEFFDFEGNRRGRVAELEEGAEDIAVSPDGRWLLYGKRDPPLSDIMLVENFR